MTQSRSVWVIRFNADGPAGLIDKSSPGRPPKLTPAQKQKMRQWVEQGPGRHDPRLVRWRRADLAEVIRDRFGLVCHPTTIGRMLRELGFSHISPRPRHPEKDDQAAAEFKNVWPAPGLQA